MFEINNVFYVVGNKGISTLHNEFHKFPSNKEYDWCATCRVGNEILVVCKEYDDEDDDDDVEIVLFNPINKQWSDANIKVKGEHYAVVYYLNKVWLIGGEQHDDVGDDDEEEVKTVNTVDGESKTLNTIEVYDPVAKSQTLAPIKLNEARSNHKVIVYKKKLFVFGGFGENGPLNSVEMFSPEDQNFVMMAPMKIARSDFACCRVGNLVYVIGGEIPVGRLLDNTNSVEIYNLDNNTWTDGVDLPVAMYDLHACAVNFLTSCRIF